MSTKQLDRRREQSTAAHEAAAKTKTTVTELENRLRTNADMTRRQTQALRNAEAEAKRLKRSLKTQARDKDRLEKAHKKAVSRAEKAQSKAATLEEKYGKSVLHDLVRREKEKDRAAASTPVSPALPAVVPPPPIEPEPPAETAPAVETEQPVEPVTARATAARSTARKAAASAATPRARAPRKTTTVVETQAPATPRRRPAQR
ncbi:hypothetical protein JIG36_21680 [Actinoplanes sp. LDG1-06]|uniref:Uncharacterized protein n=1 Tax=Paractinoplanes ovalisporus TaxID=2810368 RepID=A0ABS2AEB3_9ACTN|nr:hypothetical protein [Actinoplanes ovalisporus]MBM2618172.1 hypothetical protein [Actinoplanes ovalisporus]